MQENVLRWQRQQFNSNTVMCQRMCGLRGTLVDVYIVAVAVASRVVATGTKRMSVYRPEDKIAHAELRYHLEVMHQLGIYT